MISTSSTSLHTLNSDKGLNHFQRILWYCFNILNNYWPVYRRHTINLEVRDFVCSIDSSEWRRTDKKSSPSRKLSDLFWIHLPWEEIQSELGAINICDIGCGNGRYGEKLTEWSHGNVTGYTGVDIYHRESWEDYKQTAGFQFFEGSAQEIGQYISEDTNFFMSQSVLEHIEEDWSYFSVLDRILRTERRKAIQVHLVPSEACLKLYGLHGVRQYSVRTLTKIFRIFEDYSYGIIYRLGGGACNRLHYEFITKPLTTGLGDLRDTRTDEYDRMLNDAIQFDFDCPHNYPSFYALIIHSHFTNKIL